MRLPLQTRFATDLHGTRWRVSVRWLPWTPRTREYAADAGWIDMPDLGGFDDELGIGCLIVVLVIAAVVLLPILLFLLELVLLLIVFVVLVLACGALGVRRWTIEVEGVGVAGRTSDAAPAKVRHTLAHHRGIRAAEGSMAAIADAIERGNLDPASPPRGQHG